MKLNRKGFTLIELIATIVVLGIVASIGTYSITEIIKSSKKKNFELLVENIKSASEMLYNDCKYITTTSTTGDVCTFDSSDNSLTVSLSQLVSSGFLTSNKTKGDTGTVYNPKTGEDISTCKIKIKFFSGGTSGNYVKVTPTTNESGCPTEENYKGTFND